MGSARGCHRSAEVPHSSPCCGGSSGTLCSASRNISQHEPLAAPRQSPSAREDRVPAPQLVPISSTTLTSAQTLPWDVEASGERTFKKALLPSPFPFACLLPQNQSCFPRSRKKLVDEHRGFHGVCPCSASMDINVPKRQELQGGPSLARACSHTSPTDAQSLRQRRGKAQLVENYSVAFWKSQSEFCIQGSMQKATSVFLMLLSTDPCNSCCPFI